MPPQTSGATGTDRVVIHPTSTRSTRRWRPRGSLAPDVPLAVQQWQGIIVVNYPARAAGVKRHLTVAEAKRQCPLHLAHVETIGEDDGEETTRAETGPDERDAEEARRRRARRDTRKVTSTAPRGVKRVMAPLTASSPGAGRAREHRRGQRRHAEVDAITARVANARKRRRRRRHALGPPRADAVAAA